MPMVVPMALLIVQTVPAAAPEPGSALFAVPRACAAGPGQEGEVVVCARPRDENRLTPLSLPAGGTEKPFDPLLFRLPGGASARVHAFERDLPNGAISQGAAVTLTMPFGRKK